MAYRYGRVNPRCREVPDRQSALWRENLSKGVPQRKASVWRAFGCALKGTFVRKRSAIAVLGVVLASVLALSVPGAGAQVPLVMSDNVELLDTFPDTLAISGEFARTGDFYYTSSLDSISAFDVSDPEHPQLLDTLPTANFENESMTYGERVVDGKLQRFVILAEDIYNVSPGNPDHVHVGGAVAHIVDVTNAADGPGSMQLTGQVETEHSTHTVQCVSQADCRYAYNAGDDGFFEILDLTDLANPKVLKKVKSPAAGPNAIFTGGAGHYWDFDEVAKVGWHTGSGGAVAFDVSDPTNPVPIQATNGEGIKTPYNDFIMHNSRRPNPQNFEAGAAPSVNNGNVLLVTEEDYANDGDELLCDQVTGTEAGTFQAWYIPDLNRPAASVGTDPSTGTIRPLDIVNAPAEFADDAGLPPNPLGVFCSAHWFDYHESGIVAQGYYQQGLWLEDVRDASDIKYFGFYRPLASEVWDAYWVPKRDANGCPTGEKLDIVYTADLIRGLDVLRVSDLPAPTTDPEPLPCFVPAGNGDGDGDGNGNGGDDSDDGVGNEDDDRTGGGATLPATGGGMGLILLGATALPLAAYLGRRRR